MDFELDRIVNTTALFGDEHKCPHCGRIVPPKTLKLLGRTITVQPVCKCESEADDREKREMEIKQHKAETEAKYSALRNSPKYKACRLNNFEVTKDNKAAFEAAEEFIKNWSNSGSLVIYGRSGSGKSHLAAAIGNTLDTGDKIVVFTTFVDLLERVKATYSGGEGSESKILGAVTSADLLILDDLGVEKPSEYTLDVLFRIVDRRNRELKKTVYTSNYSPKDLLERYAKAVGVLEAQRVVGRIIEGSKIVKNNGKDKRFDECDI